MGFPGITNNSALVALRTLAQTGRNLADAQTRISSGYKVNSARENASIFTVAEGVRADISGIDAVLENISTAKATAGMTLGGLTQISENINKLKQKVIDGAGDNVDKQAIQRDVDALLGQIDAIAAAANWNGVNVLKDTPDDLVLTTSFNRANNGLSVVKTTISGIDSTVTGLGLNGLDVTVPAFDGIEFELDLGAATSYTDNDYIMLTAGGINHYFFINQDATTVAGLPPFAPGDQLHLINTDLGVETSNQTNARIISEMRSAGFSVNVDLDGSFTVTSAAGNVTASLTLNNPVLNATPSLGVGNNLQIVENAASLIKERLASLGALASGLESQGDFLKTLHSTLTEGIGTLVDADLAEESARLEALKTKQQLGIQALSIANQSQGAVLALLE